MFECSFSLKYTFEPNCLVSECVFEQSLCEKGFSVPSDWKVNDDSCSALSYYLHIPQDEQPRRLAARIDLLNDDNSFAGSGCQFHAALSHGLSPALELSESRLSLAMDNDVA